MQAGDIVGKYVLKEKIGSGAMGDVFEATNADQHVAVKVLKVDDETLAARFLREAKTMSLFAHPNIVELVEVGKLDDGRLFLATELVRGVTLRSLIEGGPVEPHRALGIVRQVLSALGHAHAMGVVHRDIKPENVMLVDGGAPDGKSDLVKILDFGVAKLIGDTPAVLGEGTLTITGYGALGTPYYMSPEAVFGRAIDARADLYSIGVLLFELLTGKPPYTHDDVAVLMRMHAGAPIPSVPDATPELALVINEALAKKPEGRFKSAAEMIEAVDAAMRSLDPFFDEAVAPTRPAKTTDVFGMLPMKPPAQTEPSASAPAAFSPSSIPSASQPIVEPPVHVGGPVMGVVVPASGHRPSAPMFAPPMPQMPLPQPKPANQWVARGLELGKQHQRKLMFAGMGAFGLIILITIIVAVKGCGSKSAPPPDSAKTAALVHAAQEQIAAGRPGRAAELIEREPIADSADLLVVLGHACIASGRRLDGLAAYERAIQLDKKYAADAQVRGNIVRVLDTRDAVAGVVALELAMQLQPPAYALLEQLATSGKVAEVRRRALAIAEREKISKGIDRVESWSLDLAQATTCEERLSAVLKLRRSADPRAIPALKKAKAIRCVEREVAEAIAYLESRPAGSQP